MIIALYGYNGASQTGVSTVTGGGMAWARRAAYTQSSNVTIEEWYATTTAALSAATITASIGALASQSLIAFGINGGVVVPKFDTAAGLPSEARGSGLGGTVSITTKGIDDFIFQGVVGSTGTLQAYTPSGITQLIGSIAPNSQPNLYAYYGVQYAPVTSYSVGIGLAVTNPWAQIVDAVTNLPLAGGVGAGTFHSSVAVVPTNPIALDGHGFTHVTSQTSATISITTIFPNDVIVLLASYAASQRTTSVSGGGLTWTQRGVISNPNASPAAITQEEWYAVASTPLNAAQIIFTQTGTSKNISLMIFGVSGADTAIIWDSNPSLPATNQNGGGSGTVTTALYSTSNNQTFIFGVTASDNLAAQTWTAVTPFSMLDSSTVNATPQQGDAYAIVSAPQSGQTFEIDLGLGTSWCTLVDAIVQSVSALNPAGTEQGVASMVVTSPIALSIDGFVSKHTTSLSTMSATISTNFGSGVLVAYPSYSALPATITISDTAGLTWTMRTRSTAPTRANTLEEWWAPYQNALTNDVVTIAYPAPASIAPNLSLMVVAVYGADQGNPFDLNPSLPAIANDTGNKVAANVTTSYPTAMILGATASNNKNGQTWTPNGNFQLLISTNNNSQPQYALESEWVTTQQTNLNAGFGLLIDVDWTLIADALVPANLAGEGQFHSAVSALVKHDWLTPVGHFADTVTATPIWYRGGAGRFAGTAKAVASASESRTGTFSGSAKIVVSQAVPLPGPIPPPSYHVVAGPVQVGVVAAPSGSPVQESLYLVAPDMFSATVGKPIASGKGVGEGRFGGVATMVISQPAKGAGRFAATHTVLSTDFLSGTGSEAGRATYVASQHLYGEGQFAATKQVISHQNQSAEGRFAGAVTAAVANELGLGEGRFKSTVSVVASGKGVGAGRFASTVTKVASGQAHGTGAFRDTFILLNRYENVHGGFSSSVSMATAGTVTPTGGFSSGVTVYAYVGGSDYIAEGETESKAGTTEVVEAAPGIYKFFWDKQQGWTA
jgi:hypothetical protein